MIFSKRHRKSLKGKTLQISVPAKIRIRLRDLFLNFDEAKQEWNDWISRIDLLKKRVPSERGEDDCWVWKDKESIKVDSIQDWFEACIPEVIFDAIEIYPTTFNEIPSGSSKNAESFERQVNRIFVEDDFPWQVASGQVFKIESKYFAEEVHSLVHHLIQKTEFSGLADEFKKARDYLTEKDYRNALKYASDALESAMKSVLGEGYDKKGQKDLIKAICSNAFLPTYSFKHLEQLEEFCKTPLTVATNESRHGQGAKDKVIPAALAELVVNWVAALIQFLVRRYLEKNVDPNESKKKKSPDTIDDYDLPF